MFRLVIIITLSTCLWLSGCDSKSHLQPLTEDAVILAFGDSITRGTGAHVDEAYPAQLGQLIHRQVINAGIPGEVSGSGLQRLPALLEQHQPDLLILCHGGNDILRHNNLELTRQNLQKMIDLAQQRGVQVVLIAVPQFGIFLSPAPFYAELAKHNQIPLDNSVLSDILRKNTLKSDHIHPNAKGYRVMAEQIMALLQDAGAL